MKINIEKSLIMAATSVAVIFSSCTDHKSDTGSFPLDSFYVKAGDKVYNADIDQNSHIVTIRETLDTRDITEVCYSLGNRDSAIEPDPSSFIGTWQLKQKVDVICGEDTTSYIISIPNMDEDGRSYIFRDEFNVDGIPDRNKWKLCSKGTVDWNEEMSESYDQVYVRDGCLFLTAEKVDGIYKSSGIESQGLFGFTFGRVECRARLTKYPNGAFPAIWMMPQKAIYPSGWPYCGEIDIMEHIKQENAVWQTIHSNYRNNLGNYANTSVQKACNFPDWTVYGLEWTEEYIAFFVDGVQTLKYSNMHLPDEAEKMQWPFGTGSEFYLILNMGLGARPNSWAGYVDDSGLPAIMEIDWIRVSTIDAANN